jgi:hypothetical protein
MGSNMCCGICRTCGTKITIKCFVTFVKTSKTNFLKGAKKKDKCVPKSRKAQKGKPTHSVKQEVCHTVAMPLTLKSKYLKAKEEL